jgi:Zn-dependent protease with chaperone function
VTVSGFGRRVRVVFPEALAAEEDTDIRAFAAAKALAARGQAAGGVVVAANAVFAAGAFFLASRFTQAVAHAAGLPGGDGALGAFPLLAGSLFALAVGVGLLGNAVSRALEIRSDVTAADWAGGKEAARKAIAAEAEAAGEPRELPAWAVWFRKTPTPGERMRAVDGTRAGE